MEEAAVPPPLPELSSPVAALVEQFAPHSQPIVITGPIGAGKTYVAHLVHQASGRKGAFVPVPLTSLTPGFEHVTLAGHEKGAYTGAHQGRRGLLAEASNGTLFLDEIGDASLEGQRILLELLTERGLRRLGEERRVRFDLRFILATHVDLDRACADGRFREDLLSRLGHCWIHVPALRERSNEIPPLVRYYLARARGDAGLPPLKVAPELMAALLAAPWIYNVRSLMSECQSLATARPPDRVLRVAHLSPRFWGEVRKYLAAIDDSDERMAAALRVTGGQRALTASVLDVTERTVYRKATPKRTPRPKLHTDLTFEPGGSEMSG